MANVAVVFCSRSRCAGGAGAFAAFRVGAWPVQGKRFALQLVPSAVAGSGSTEDAFAWLGIP